VLLAALNLASKDEDMPVCLQALVREFYASKEEGKLGGSAMPLHQANDQL